ncbi:SNF2-like protein [Rhodopirellula maiorica SM1]|uniref:SNF2-like protein n=2 Tax=Novipirellula TaxID=2795426 RepID=M5RT29_9BACT|nr:SNF2-like protein [Rhodopirellula maiorica SM1]
MLNQWIGRIDRLGRDRVDPDKRNSPVKDVKLVLFHRPGDPSRDVETLFSGYQLFRRSLQLDPLTVNNISQEIDDVVIRANQSSSASPNATSLANVSGVDSGRWTPEHSQDLYERIAHAEPMAPVLASCKYDAYVSSNEESALGNWIEQLCAHGMMSKKKVSKRFRGDGKRRVFSTLTQMGCDGPPVPRLEVHDQSFPAFVLARWHTLNPPRTEVTTGLDHQGQPRKSRLHFLSHGGMLHDQIVQTYAKAGKTHETIGFSIQSLGLRFYPAGVSLHSGRYLCGVGFVDSGSVYAQALPQKSMVETTQSKQLQRVLAIESARHVAGLKADQRFIRQLAPAKLCVRASREDAGKYTPCDGGELFTPHWGKDVVPQVQRVPVAEKLREKLPLQYKVAIAKETKEHWSDNHRQIREHVEERIECIRLEAAERLRLTNTMLSNVETQVQERRANATKANDQWIQLRLRPRSDLLMRQRDVIQENCAGRCELLQKSLEFVQSPPPESVSLQVTAQIHLRDDPEAIFDQVSSDPDPITDFHQSPTSADPDANPRKPR